MALPHVLIIDAQSLAARAAHVAAGDAVAGSRLWCQMARGAALDIGATHLIAAWDHDGPTFRHTLFPSYKHRRTGNMRTRVAPIRLSVESTGVVSVSVPGFEGDDSVASLMANFRADAQVTLLSNDSDLLQFVDDGVDVATYVGVGKGPRGMRIKPWSRTDVLEKHGVLPALLPALRALSGEDGDDIPGVAHIGKGTVVKLLRRWQSLEKALEGSEYVSHRDLTARLAGQHDHVRLMLQLTTIRQDVPLPPLTLTDCLLEAISWPDGSHARKATASSGAVTKVAAGPGLEDVPFPE